MAEGRKKVMVDGREIDARADMPYEEVVRRHHELQQAIEETRVETETLDHGRISRLIAEDLSNADPPWPAEALTFFRASADLYEIAALYRTSGEPITQERRLEILQQKMDERRNSKPPTG